MLGGLKYSWWVESALRRLRLHWSDRGTCLNNQNNFVGHQTATGDHLFSKTRVLRFRESHYLATLASVFRQQIRRDFLHQFSVLNFLKAGQFGSYIIPVFEAAFEQDKKVSGANLVNYTSFLGRPLGLRVSSKPCRFAVASTHFGLPNGQPRLIQFSNASVSFFVTAWFTRSIQLASRLTGQAESRTTEFPPFQFHRLPQR